MYCINCGKELPENARFCLYCGTKVNIEEKAQVSNEEVLINNFGNTIPFIYDELSGCTDYPYIYGYINGKVGLLDANDASMVIPCQYDKINPYFYTQSKQFAYSEVNKDGKWGFYEKGKEIIPCIYDDIEQNDYNNIRIYTTHIGVKKGLINSNTWVKTECIYDEINFEKDGIYVNIADKHGIFDSGCKELLPCQFEQYEKINRWQYKVYNDKKRGIYSIQKSDYIVPCLYDDICNIDDSYYKIMNNGKYGIFKDKEILAPIYDNIEYVPCKEQNFGLIRENGYFKVYYNRKVGLFSLEGSVIFHAKYDSIERFLSMVYPTNMADGFHIPHRILVSIGYITQLNNKVSFVAQDIKEFTGSSKLKFSSVKLIYNDEYSVYYKVCCNGKWGIYTSSAMADIEISVFILSDYPIPISKELPCQYDSLQDIVIKRYDKEIRYYIYSKNGKYGILNEKFQEYVPCKYDEIKDVKFGLYSAKLNGKWGVNQYPDINIIPFLHDNIELLHDNIGILRERTYKVSVCGKYGGVNLNWGDNLKIGICTPICYDDVQVCNMRIVVAKNGKWRFYNKSQEEYFIYDKIIACQSMFHIVVIDKMYGIASTSNKEVVQCIFPMIEFDTIKKEFIFYKSITDIIKISRDDFEKMAFICRKKGGTLTENDKTLIELYNEKGLTISPNYV